LKSRQLRYRFLVPFLVAITILTVVASIADAQETQGAIFNSSLFNVGGVGERMDPSLPGTQGSVGCGSGWGDDLSIVLDAALNQSVGSDLSLPEDQRRDLWRFCDYMTSLGAGWDNNSVITPQAEALQNTSIAPADFFGKADVAQSIANWQMGAIATRIQQIRTTARGKNEGQKYALAQRLQERADSPTRPSLRSSLRTPVALSGGDTAGDREYQDLNVADIAKLLQEGVNAGDAMGVPGLGVFLSGRYVHLDADSTNRERGSDTDGGGFTIGADYRITPDFVMGAAFGYNHYETDFSQNAGDSELDDYAGMVFGSLFIGDTYYVDGTLRGSYLRTESTRKIANLGTGSAFADQDSDPDGWTVSADLSAGAEISMDAFLLNPYVRLSVYHTDIEDFSETGGDNSMSFDFDEQEVTSLPLALGGTVVYSIGTSVGVVAPYIRAEYLHEFLDQAADAEGFLRVIPQAQFNINPNSTDRDYGAVGAGAAITLRDGWSGYADFDALVGFSDLQTYTATLGIRKEL
jgi:outer membrane autotransporter protein